MALDVDAHLRHVSGIASQEVILLLLVPPAGEHVVSFLNRIP